MTSDPQDIHPSQPIVAILPPKELRAAAAEALLAGALLLSDVQREASNWSSSSQAKASEERFRKALEVMREALSS